MSDRHDCESCGGSGEAVIYHTGGPYGEPEIIKCRDCKGSGLADPSLAAQDQPQAESLTVPDDRP